MRRRALPWPVLALVAAAAPVALAQEPPMDAAALAARPDVRAALDRIAEAEPATIDEQIALCEIPAPPFHEAERAAAFRDRLAALGLERARLDAEGNAIAELPGEPGAPTVVLSAHLDTVFPPGTDVTVRREGPVLHGPGVADDCRGLAVVLAVARTLRETGPAPRGTVVFVGTVGEEGRGDLRGVRHLFAEELTDSVDYFISVDGGGLDLTKDAVGSHRYRVTYRGPGGHSWGDFGMPTPIHALGRAIAAIADFPVPADPKTTYNVSVVEGGLSINSIPSEASMQVDLRSGDPRQLDALDRRFRDAVEAARAGESARDPERPLEAAIESVGVRPAGTQDVDAAIVRTGIETAAALGFTPELPAGSTDANVPISLGVPAVTIDGGGKSSGTHSPDERFDSTDSHLGSQWALLYVLALAGLR